MIPLWVKKADGSYVPFPYNELHTFADGKLGLTRSPFQNSTWLIFAAETGRGLGEFFESEAYLVGSYGHPISRWVLKME